MADCGYLIGTTVRQHAVTTDINGTVADPSTLKARTLPPDGIEVAKTYPTDAEVVRTAVGTFHIDIACDQNGEWRIRWEASGNNTDVAAEDKWVVGDSRFTVP